MSKIKNSLQILGLIGIMQLSLNAQAGEPVIMIDSNTDMVSIDPQGNTSTSILEALSKKIGFQLVGKLEAGATVIDYPLNDTAQKLIEKLVKPQSVIVLFSTDDNGRQQVSQVELLPTGNAESQYLNDGEVVGFQPRKLTGDPEKDKFHMERDQRRAERHAQGLGRINQPNFGIVTQEDVDRDKNENPQQ